MQPTDTLYGVVKNGVLTLSGYVISIREDMGCLLVKDGIKGAEIERRFPRASCPISRLITIRPQGFISFSALRWMHNAGVTFVNLEYDGSPIAISLPRASFPAALRRTQASTTIESRLGKAVAGSLLQAKIAGQIATLRKFGRYAAAAEILGFGDRLSSVTTTPNLLGIEGRTSAIYWQALADMPLVFERRQPAPEHWAVLGTRSSTITGTPRGAVTPGNALLNYVYGVLESEITVALHAVGLDPALGILHADKDSRASLAYDLMEPARPVLDRWLLHWLQSATFNKRDFREDVFGFIRVTHPLNSHLAMTSALWRGMAEQLAQWIYKRLSGENVKLRLAGGSSMEIEATRRAARWKLGNRLQRPIPTTCAECGKVLPRKRRKFCSAECERSYYGTRPTEAGLAAIARARAARKASGEKMRRPASRIEAISFSAWRALPGWSRSRDAEMRAWFTAKVQPRLKDVRPRDISHELHCCTGYAISLRLAARVPHPRLYRAIAALVGVEWPDSFP
jgi:CRISPR-associated protein Cas1